jgi:hypothetical protein
MLIISYVTLIKFEGNLNNPVDEHAARAARSAKSRPHTVVDKNIGFDVRTDPGQSS